MVRRHRTVAITIAGVLIIAATSHGQTRTSGSDYPERFGFARAATHGEIDAWDIDVMPDGHGLPAGEGTAETGAKHLCAQSARSALSHYRS